MRTSLVTPYIFAALVVILAANAGLTEMLGAHPFWAVRVAWMGVPIGLVLALLAKSMGLGWVFRVLLFVTGLAAAYALASFGKGRFAASFAEDRAAGQMWYIGWIAATGFAAALIAATFSPTRSHGNTSQG